LQSWKKKKTLKRVEREEKKKKKIFRLQVALCDEFRMLTSKNEMGSCRALACEFY